MKDKKLHDSMDVEVEARNQKFEEIELANSIDERIGFIRYTNRIPKTGWLINMNSTILKDADWPSGRAAVEYYFIEEDGGYFKASITFSPYFFVLCKNDTENEVEDYLRKRFSNLIEKILRVEKEDLDLLNHLSGLKRKLIKLVFRNNSDLLAVRKILLPAAIKNAANLKSSEVYENLEKNESSEKCKDLAGIDCILQLREYDIPYHLRVSIDLDIQIGYWYEVWNEGPKTKLKKLIENAVRPDPVVLAFDIETTKLPLKFPDASFDNIMMISYMVDGRGFLIVNRELVSQDIENFEFTPKPEFEGHFTIFNESNEKALLLKFFEHFQELRPTVVVTYNGDSFDWPFVEARAKHHSIDLYNIIGFSRNSQGEYCSTFAAHMDAYKWVKRDSYLPAGSQGLKAVTKIKLGYNPDEIDPEDMTRFAKEQPHTLASYSVSDAVATYYLYMKYVHPFIFSLCMIIPLSPDEVLRKGTGTLCETLLMAEAFHANVLMPNKHVNESGKMHNGHLLESETYVGGHVEALESGVFRSDLPTKFNISVEALETLINDLDRALKFTTVVEGNINFENIENYQEVYCQIKEHLEQLKETPKRDEEPLIYHLDVGSMYPNIILTNRLQPSSIVSDSICASCDFNTPMKNCQRKMSWAWRGEFFTAKRSEYRMIRNQIETEKFTFRGKTMFYNELLLKEQEEVLYKRLGEYCRKVYHRIRQNEVIIKESTVCMKENSFYVDTVRRFRDRRYDYKNLHKEWKKKLDESVEEGNLLKIEEGKKMFILYDSLQLAHKCILNSFYGYVMRKGARWYSMDMAGIVCHTGSSIITLARQLVEKIGRPLELDTDGIWCILPKSFPQNFSFKLKNGKKYDISYPCVMLNHLVNDKFTNDQYHTLQPDGSYSVSKENSIFFEIDGPYKAMILPSSKEEDKLLKKRYAVFNLNGSLAELKGFEIKRRGELKLIKFFQSQIFDTFLQGTTLEECYAAAAKVADYWLDILYTQGENLEDFELFDLISENRNMSKSLEEYGEQKSTSISTAKRLAEFLGDQMIKDKGLSCQFIISRKPADDPVASRAIPVAIFSADVEIKRYYLRKWLKDPSLETINIRDILDWKYYIERLESVIQKLITIPAAMQMVANPVPRVKHPDWLHKKTMNKNSAFKQGKLDLGMLDSVRVENSSIDIEDIGNEKSPLPTPPVAHSFKAVPSDNPVEISENYSGWVAMKKSEWKRRREEKQQNRILGNYVPKSRGSSKFFQSGSALGKCPLEIIQIQSTSTPGEFKLWAIVGGNLEAVKVFVPKILYVNSKVENTCIDIPAHRVFLTLPRSHKSYFLYELAVPEKEFFDNSAKYTQFFEHPSIEGVYESKVPPIFRAITLLGCVCTVSNVQQIKPNSPIDIRNFVFRTSGYHSYLEKTCFNYVYFYYATLGSRNIVVVLFSKFSKGKIVVFDASKPVLLNWNDIYKEKIMGNVRANRSSPFLYNNNVEFEQQVLSNEKAFFKAVSKIFSDYQEMNIGVSIVITEAQQSMQWLYKDFPILTDFPCVSFPFALQNMDAFQMIDWQRIVSRTVIDHFLGLNNWIHDRMNAARYSHIPFGNLDGDISLLISDVFFARILKNSGHVLWYSSSALPDLGGRENDENFIDQSEFNDFAINAPGGYSSICVELEISSLALNTVLQSGVLSEVEGIDLFDNLDVMVDHMIDSRNENVEKETYEESQISKKVFHFIKSLLDNWTKDFLVTSNPVAEKLLNSLLRWIKSKSSGLYDFAIYKKIRLLINKMYLQLIAKLNQLGCQIVYGNYSKIIINCKKETLENAESYINFVIKEVQSMELFSWIEIHPLAFWESLYWMDCANYGGYILIDNEKKLYMTWNIMNSLPKGLHNAFKAVIAECLESYSVKKEKDSSREILSMIEEKEDSYCEQGFLSFQFIQRFLGSVKEIDKTFTGKYTDPVDIALKSFPIIPGVEEKPANAALEFAKTVCAVFALNKSVSEEVNTLKRHALAIIGIREFSDEAQFSLVQNTFILPEIICPSCNHSKDFDLCRDVDLNPADNVPSKWLCSNCPYEFDKAIMEHSIISRLGDLLAAYSVQDLICQLCYSVKECHLISKCNCSGNYGGRVSNNKLRSYLKILGHFAKNQDLPILLNHVDWISSHTF